MGHIIKSEDLPEVNKDSRILDDPSKYSKRDPQETLDEKKCLDRNSLLTEMSQYSHVYSIYKVIMVFLFAFIFKEITLHFLGIQNFDLAFDLIQWNFGGIGTTFVYWMGMFSSSVMYYYGFYFWATERRKLLKLGKKQHMIEKWDNFFMFSMIVYMITFLIVPCIFLLQRNLPVISTTIVLFEQVRFIMKKYAFSRSNIPGLVINCEDEEFDKCLPSLSKFIYFLFAPTLIYRHYYPRRSNVNWKVVIWNFINFVAMIVMWAIVFKRYVIIRYQDVPQEKFTWILLASNIIHTTLPMLVLHFATFHLLLHSWMNAFAEMLQFPDRMFYKDWWTSSNYGRFFRTWNVVVGDWLYVYIYKDIALLTAVKDKDTKSYKVRPIIPRLAVFIVSALFHEYILAFTFKFLYPLQFILFTVLGGLLTSFVKTKGDVCNVMMIFSLGFGEAILFALYCVEWYARKVCPMQLENGLMPEVGMKRSSPAHDPDA